MEFNFSVNALFREKIVNVKNNLLPENHLPDRRGDGDVVSKVAVVLDKMGVVSAKAQNLPVAITSASKLRNTDHVVYILTDPEGNKGHGTVVGILKVGRKKLFIYDLTGTQWEMEPLCVLDFYVHESKQRSGCGKMLFDHMLKEQRVNPKHLALDQPSEIFLSFMCKHYGLDSIIPQINSFVVYDKFFDGRSDKGRSSSAFSSNSKTGRTPVQSVKALSRSGDMTPLPIYGRHSAKKAGSVMAEYMQDTHPTPHNGTRQTSHPTNHSHQSATAKTSASKMLESEDKNGSDSQTQIRPSSLPEKLHGPVSVSPLPRVSPESSHVSESQGDVPDAAGDASVHNGTTLSPEEVPGKLDLKFHHTHLCDDVWNLNHHSVPLAQYGHYWSSVGGLLSEDQNSETETDGEPYQNGNGLKHQIRKVSNIPMGEDSQDEDNDISQMIPTLTLNTNQNGHPFTVGTAGTRDVRIKKTMFKNLSPYRK